MCHGVGKLTLGWVIPFFQHVEALGAVGRYLEIMGDHWMLSSIKGFALFCFNFFSSLPFNLKENSCLLCDGIILNPAVFSIDMYES